MTLSNQLVFKSSIQCRHHVASCLGSTAAGPAHLAIRFPVTVPHWPLACHCLRVHCAFCISPFVYCKIIQFFSNAINHEHHFFLRAAYSHWSRVIESVQSVTAWIRTSQSSVINCLSLTKLKAACKFYPRNLLLLHWSNSAPPTENWEFHSIIIFQW